MLNNYEIDKKKICFIIAAKNQEECNKCISYIEKLEMPRNFSKDILLITKAKSMTSAYNSAIKKTKAKYKIYLHQDVYIINKWLIFDMLKLFKKHHRLGLIGLAGAKLLPTNCIWGAAPERYGLVYHYGKKTNKLLLSNFGENTKIDGDYVSVEAVDGLIMMTQYDITWREDVFNGWHYYDLSQCIEFIKAGYDVGVPNMDKPWCIHCQGNNLVGYEKAQKAFIAEYREFLNL